MGCVQAQAHASDERGGPAPGRLLFCPLTYRLDNRPDSVGYNTEAGRSARPTVLCNKPGHRDNIQPRSIIRSCRRSQQDTSCSGKWNPYNMVCLPGRQCRISRNSRGHMPDSHKTHRSKQRHLRTRRSVRTVRRRPGSRQPVDLPGRQPESLSYQARRHRCRRPDHHSS